MQRRKIFNKHHISLNRKGHVMKTTCFIIPGLLLLLISSCGSKSEPQVEDAALQAARQWLALIDSADYTQSWDEAATFFKGAVSKEKWQEQMNAARKPLGETISREEKSKKFYTSLPGAPDGEYVVIQFSTSFTNKKSAIETVTPMRDDDGSWRVSGYYIK
jgi:hypothetical protein